MINPLDDQSHWTLMGARTEIPQDIIDEFRTMFREAFGDKVTDAIEATIPPPYGTLKI